MPLDLSANLDDLVKRLAVVRAEQAHLDQEAKSLAESIRTSVADLGTYPCANGLTLTLSPNRRFSMDKALAYVTAPGNEPLAQMVAQYVLTVDRDRLEAAAPEVAAACWEEHDWKVSVK
jgi:hypothetical protein